MGADCLTSEEFPPPAGQGTCPGLAAWGLVLNGPAGLFGPGLASAAAPGHLAVALEGRPGRAVSLQLLESKGVLSLSAWSAPFSPGPFSSLRFPLTSFQVQSPLRHLPSDWLRRLLCAARSSPCVHIQGRRAVRWQPGYRAVPAVLRALREGGVASARPAVMSRVSGAVLGTGRLLNILSHQRG